jgi:hypothetical protein
MPIAGATTTQLTLAGTASNGIQFFDAAKYRLKYVYTDCKGQKDSAFTDAANLFVYGNTEIVEQSTTLYAFNGGVARLFVTASTVGAEGREPATYQWYRNSAKGPQKLVNGDNINGATSSTLVINPVRETNLNDQTQADDYYYCEVIGICNSDKSSPVTVKLVPEIRISKQPVSANKCADSLVEFEVIAAGTEASEPIRFQWYYANGTKVANDGTRINGATTNKLTISDLQVSDANRYYVFVEYVNLGAGISSDTVSLSVEASPIITTDLPPTIQLTEPEELRLIVAVQEQYAGYAVEYQWFKDDKEIAGAKTNTLHIAETDSVQDHGKYYVVVKSVNGCSEAKSQVTTVTIRTVGIFEYDNPNFRILSVTPNPVTMDAQIVYTLPAHQEATLMLTDLSGKTVLELFNGMASEGKNIANLSGINSMVSGTYFVVLESQGRRTAFKINISK